MGACKKNLEKGVHYEVKKLPKKKREQLMADALAYDNHKSATENEDICEKMAAKDADLGYSAVFPVDCAAKIANGDVYPLGVQFQNSINEKGENYIKSRLTHDLSFPEVKLGGKLKRNLEKFGIMYPLAKKIKVPNLNSRCDNTTLTPCIYGQSLRQFCHLIGKNRLLCPSSRMMGTKIDCDKAYRRAHTSTNSAARNMAIVAGLLYVLFCLPFGAAPAPPEGSIIMEMIVDLATELVKYKSWDPSKLKSPWSVFSPKTSFDPVLQNPPIAYEMNVDVPVDDSCPAGVEGYVDDGIAVMAGDKDLMEHTYEYIPLATHVFFRPVKTDEPVHRPPPLSETKCYGEGLMAEDKIFLGWQFFFNLHLIQLTQRKSDQYITDLTGMICTRETRTKQIESVVGKINVVGFVLPATRHFTARLRRCIIKYKAGDNALDDEEIEDSQLWIKFLRRAVEGVNINMAANHPATGVCISDACEIGIGGYTNNGIFWRFYLPVEWNGKLTLNILEYLASFFTVEFELGDSTHPFPVLDTRLDSTTADA